MAQGNNRNKKQKLHVKYRIRRTVLLLLVFVVAAGALGFAWNQWMAPRFTQEETEGEMEVEGPEEQDPVGVEPSNQEPEQQQLSQELLNLADPDQEWNLILVNGSEPLPEDFEIEDLEIVADYWVDARIADSLKRMVAKAKEDGISLVFRSGYRTVELQTTNFEAKVQEYLAAGYSQEEAYATTAMLIAVPGESEHHTGLAVDIVSTEFGELEEEFENTRAFDWLSKNAEDYGFVLRFPKDKVNITKITYEPWHYRYVGEEHAKAMNEKGYCLEEYVHELRQERERLIAQMGSSYEELLKVQEEDEEQGGEEEQTGEPQGERPADPKPAQVPLPSEQVPVEEDGESPEDQGSSGTLYNEGGAAINDDQDSGGVQ